MSDSELGWLKSRLEYVQAEFDKLEAELEQAKAENATLEAENARLRERHDMLLRHSRPCDVSESMGIDLGDIPEDVSIIGRLNELIDAAINSRCKKVYLFNDRPIRCSRSATENGLCVNHQGRETAQELT